MRKSCLKQVYETSPKKPRNFNIKLQNTTFTNMINKKTHFEQKKSTKNHSHHKKWHHEKTQKKTLLFLKTLAGRTALSLVLDFWLQEADDLQAALYYVITWNVKTYITHPLKCKMSQEWLKWCSDPPPTLNST